MAQKTQNNGRTRTQDLLQKAKNALKRNSRMVLVATALFAGAILAPRSWCPGSDKVMVEPRCGDKVCDVREKYAKREANIDDKLFCKDDCCPNMDDGKCTPEDKDKCSPCYSPKDCDPVCNHDKVCGPKETVKGCSDCVPCNGKKISKKDTECKPGERFDKKSCICKTKPQAVVVTQGPECGDGKCESPETISSCLKDCGFDCNTKHGMKKVPYKPECQPNSPTLVNGGCEDGKICTSACKCKENKPKPTACTSGNDRKPHEKPRLYMAIRNGISKVSSLEEYAGRKVSKISGRKVGAKACKCTDGSVGVTIKGGLDPLQQKMVAASIRSVPCRAWSS